MAEDWHRCFGRGGHDWMREIKDPGVRLTEWRETCPDCATQIIPGTYGDSKPKARPERWLGDTAETSASSGEDCFTSSFALPGETEEEMVTLGTALSLAFAEIDYITEMQILR